MMKTRDSGPGSQGIDSERRRLLGAAGAGALAAAFGGVLAGTEGRAEQKPTGRLRWGVVGTGGIANSMAPMMQQATHAELVAVSSRKMETARAFAEPASGKKSAWPRPTAASTYWVKNPSPT